VNFFKLCRTFVATCKIENLPRLVVETTSYCAKVSRTFQMYSHAPQLDLKIANDVVAEAKGFLTGAKEPCQQKYQNTEVLGNAVDETLRLLGKEWYEKATPEEIAAIKVSDKSFTSGVVPSTCRIL
jgi:hypothetical protein